MQKKHHRVDIDFHQLQRNLINLSIFLLKIYLLNSRMNHTERKKFHIHTPAISNPDPTSMGSTNDACAS